MSTVPAMSNGVPTEQDARQIHDPSSTYTTYQIDPAASRVEFSIHKRLFFVVPMMVVGRFADVQGTIKLDEREPATARAEVTIGAASINTRMAKRDKHLRKADFFDVKRYPTLTFRGRGLELVDRAAGRYRVMGDLTVRGVTREVVLDAHYLPPSGEDATGRIRLTLTAPLNRRDFGMVWDRPYIHVADDLTVMLTIEATRVPGTSAGHVQLGSLAGA